MHTVDYRRLFETAPVGIVFHNVNGHIFDANPAAERILGLTLAQMQGRTSHDPRWHAIREDGSPFPGESHPAMVALREGVQVQDVIMGVFNPRAEQLTWIRIDAVPVFRAGEAAPIQAYATFEDVTEQIVTKAEEGYQRELNDTLRHALAVLTTLTDMESALRLILQLVEGVVSYEVGSIYLVEGDRAALKYRRSIAGEDRSITTADARLMELPRFRSVIREQKPYLLTDVTTVDDWVPIAATEWIRSAIGTPIVASGRVLGVLALEHSEPNHFLPRDLAALDAFARYAGLALDRIAIAEQTLRASEDRWRFALEGAGDGVLDWDLVTDTIFFSKRWRQLFGCAEPAGNDRIDAWLDRIHPDDLDATRAALTAHIGGATPEYEHAHRAITGKGDHRWMLVRGKVIEHDADGRPLRFIATHTDITERRQIEEQLARQSALQRILMDTALEFINIPVEQLDQAIHDVLGVVGQFNHSDRAYVFDYDFVGNVLYNTYEWCAPGIEPQLELLSQPDSLENYPVWVNAHVQGMPVYVPDVGALEATDPLRLVLEPQGIKTLIALPMFERRQCVGFVGFDAVREQRAWNDADIALLKLLAELIVNARQRQRHETMIEQARRNLQDSEKRLLDAQHIANLGAWEYEVRSGDVRWSDEVFRIFGLEPTPDTPNLDRILHDLLPVADRERLVRAMESAIGKGIPYELELSVIRPDGSQAYTLVRGVPEGSAADGTLRLFGSVLDITMRKQSELALQQALMRERELSELKSRFVAMTSHELRTPLATILATTETLLAYGERLDREQWQQRLRKIVDRVEHLRSIIGDVLQLTRLETGVQPLLAESQNLDDFCSAILADYAERPDLDRRMHLERSPIPLPVRIDTHLLRQAIDNVLENAIKYSAPGSEITVRLYKVVDHAVIAVEDHGIGIPESSLKHLYEPFHRAENARLISGTGLGLPIAQEIILLHNGKIDIKSQVGAGTLVEVTIPLDREG